MIWSNVNPYYSRVAGWTAAVIALALGVGTSSALMQSTTCSASNLYPTGASNLPAQAQSGSFTFSVFTGYGSDTGCTILATPNQSWITTKVTQGATIGTVSYSVAANPGVALRTGNILVGPSATSGASFPISQLGSPASLSFSPSSLSFAPPFGTTSASQTLAVTSQPTNSAVNVSVPNAPWLSVTPLFGVTPMSLNVQVNTANLSSGIHIGTIHFALNTSASNTINVTPAATADLPVTLTVTTINTTPLLLITPQKTTFSFNRALPSSPPAQTVALSSRTGANVGYGVSTRIITPPGGNWLSAGPSSGSTPANVTISVDPSKLGRGTFVGVVTVTPFVNTARVAGRDATPPPPPPQNIIVTAGDIAPGPFSVTPSAITLDSNTLSMSVSVNNTAATNTTATPVTTPDGWLTLDKLTAPTPFNLMATGIPGQLAPDIYTGVLAIDDAAGTGANAQSLDVKFAVAGAGPTLTVGQDSVSATLQSGGPSTTFTIPAMSGTGLLPVSTQVLDGASWLSATTGTTAAPQSEPSGPLPRAVASTPPTPVTLNLDPSKLNPGSYDDAVEVSSPTAINKAYVAVHLTVLPRASAATPVLTEVTNGASFAKGQPITPGSLITLKGVNLGTGTSSASSIPLPFNLGNTSLTLNGFPAPLLYVSGSQINAQLPWNVLAVGSTSGTVDAVVKLGNQSSAPFQIFVQPVSPGIFIDFGSGRAIAQNADGTLVAPVGAYPTVASRPAKAGGVVTILSTGLGAVNGQVANGAAAGASPLRLTTIVPTVLVGGIPAQVLFSGLQPQFVGINQVNIVIPSGLPTGDAALQFQEGGITTTNQVKLTIGN